MAAFTTFTHEALERYLVMFGKGELVQSTAIESGIENSNYFLTLDLNGSASEYVLTIVEQLGFDEAPFFNKVVTHLYQYGLSVAAPETTLDGMSSTIFCGKPAFLVPKLTGRHPETPNAAQCFTIGEFLAGMHQSLAQVKVTRANPYDAAWMHSSIDTHESRLDSNTAATITALAEQYAALSLTEMPSGLIHGDLFRDNALFDADTLGGVIDFYHTCHDLLAMDLAVVINDWCLLANAPALQSEVLRGYESIRPLEPAEKSALPTLQQIAAARFALTRLASGNPPLKNPEGMITLVKNLS